MSFLKRRISVSVWELLVLLVLAIAFATVYRLYFSRAVTLAGFGMEPLVTVM